MGEPGSAEVVERLLRDLLVLAKDHPAGKIGVRTGQPGAHAGLGPAAKRVECAGDAAPRRSAGLEAVERQLVCNAAAAEVGGVVEGGAGAVMRALEQTGDLDARARRPTVGPAQAGGGAGEQVCALCRTARELQLSGRAETRLARALAEPRLRL